MELLNYEILNASAEADKNAMPMFTCDTYPCFIDVAFSKNMSVHEVAPVFPENTEVDYEVFSSLDGVNFYKFSPGGKIARYIRVFIKYYSGAHPSLNNIEIIGEDCSFPQKKAQFTEPPVFEGSEYDREITDEDIIAEVRGIISRAIGEKYAESFELKLDRRLREDYFTVESLRGKIRLISNNGVGLASAFNCYLREVCHCHISRFGKQLKLPASLPQVSGKIDRKTEFRHRYAYNYCTHSYSMMLWGEEEWQKEIDYLAMNGVNMVLDITGMEEVYRRFLTKLGYRHREIKNFLVGPAYFAWFYMGNIQGVGGPLHDGFFAERTALARKNHLRMRTLGMDIVLQGYMGMVPFDIQKKDKDVPVIPQGRWCGLQRPNIVRPDSMMYVKYAQLFYESQREVFGDITHYYAGDLCHEGGTMGRAKQKDAYRTVIQSMLAYDKDAVWVLQAWGLNPTRKFTRIMKNYRNDHILMLDLHAERKPRSEGRWAPLHKYNYLFGFLNNFGGRNSIYGNLDTLAGKIKGSSLKRNFKGIAYTAESHNVTPVMMELFNSTVWDDIPDMNKWISDFCLRRYGKENENLVNSLVILSQTALSGGASSQKEDSNAEGLICARPGGSPKRVSAWGSTAIYYDEARFDEAVWLFLVDYDKFKKNECYIFDAVDLLRQAISNRINTVVRKMDMSYKLKDYDEFTAQSEKLLSLADTLDKVLLNDSRHSLASYIGRTKEYSDKLDDFTRELYMINAKALITTWYSRRAADGSSIFSGALGDSYLHDYSNRQLGDLVGGFYKARWEMYIDNVKAELNGEKPKQIDWFKMEWDWVLSETEYTQKVREDSLKAIGKQVLGEK